MVLVGKGRGRGEGTYLLCPTVALFTSFYQAIPTDWVGVDGWRVVGKTGVGLGW